jgi:hypothetical protein
MESLARFVIDRGKPAPMPPQPLTFFGLPTDDVTFYELRAVSQSGRTKGIFVRKRPDADVFDIFLVDLDRTLGGYFYLTALHAHLTNAAYFDKHPESVPNAAERFEQKKNSGSCGSGRK